LTIASGDRSWGGSGKESRLWRVETRARSRLRRELVLVDQPAEQVTAAYAIEVDHVGEWLLAAERRPLRERSVRPMLVEMPHVRDQHVLEVAAAEDQQPVETLPTDASGPPLGMGAELGSTRRLKAATDAIDTVSGESLIPGDETALPSQAARRWSRSIGFFAHDRMRPLTYA
jgi:hypothetical protein